MSDEQWVLIAVGAGAAALLAGVVVWLRSGYSLLGPLFWYELVALARRGQQPRLRGLLAGLLLVGLMIAYLGEFRDNAGAALSGTAPLTQTKASNFARAFMVVVLVVQLAVVVLITPAVVGGAIAEEKEHGTLDFLRTSLLTNREIVFGKLAARLVYVGGVAAAGLPVLALTMLFGAVDVSVLFGGYLVTAMSALSLGAFSLLVAVHRDTLRDTLVQVYLVVIGLTVAGTCCGCIPGVAAISPPSALGYIFIHEGAIPSERLFWIHLGLVTLFHGGGGLLCAALAVRGIRQAPQRPRPKPPRPNPWFDDEPVHEPTPRTRRTFDVPRLGDNNPLLWKEQHFSGRIRSETGVLFGCGLAMLTMVIFLIGLYLFFSLLGELNRGNWIGEALNPPVRLFVAGATLFLGVAIGVRAAGSVAREREKQTLDALLMLPLARGDLLGAKWLAQFLWARYWLGAIAVVVATATLLGGVQPVGLFEGLVQVAGWFVLMASLGVWLSVRCRTVTRATVYLLLTVVALVAGPIVLGPMVDAFWPTGGRLAHELSLPVGVWQGLYSWEDFSNRDRSILWYGARLVRVAAGLAYLACAGLLWHAARQQFQGGIRQDG